MEIAILFGSFVRDVFEKSITKWLGHSNFSTTANIYAHLDSNSKQLSAQAITSAFEAKKEIEECDSSTSSNKLVACAN